MPHTEPYCLREGSMTIGRGVAAGSKIGSGRWRVRWTERVQQADGSTVRRQRERIVGSREQAATTRREIEQHALDCGSGSAP